MIYYNPLDRSALRGKRRGQALLGKGVVGGEMDHDVMFWFGFGKYCGALMIKDRRGDYRGQGSYQYCHPCPRLLSSPTYWQISSANAVNDSFPMQTLPPLINLHTSSNMI